MGFVEKGEGEGEGVGGRAEGTCKGWGLKKKPPTTTTKKQAKTPSPPNQ